MRMSCGNDRRRKLVEFAMVVQMKVRGEFQTVTVVDVDSASSPEISTVAVVLVDFRGGRVRLLLTPEIVERLCGRLAAAVEYKFGQ